MGCACENKEKQIHNSVTRQAGRNSVRPSILTVLGLWYDLSGLTWALIGRGAGCGAAAAEGNTRTLPLNWNSTFPRAYKLKQGYSPRLHVLLLIVTIRKIVTIPNLVSGKVRSKDCYQKSSFFKRRTL